MKKPNYDFYHSKVMDTYSITEAERMIDQERSRYKEAMRKWWKSLSLKEKKEEWKKDNSLSFYVDDPNKRRKK
jgi:hypothetical protein